MNTELVTAIESLYRTFSIYAANSKMEGCPCCVSENDKKKTHSKVLRELEEDELSRYAFKAITTWGNVEDFKHFLPRIFELLATTNFCVDVSVVLGKLELADWVNWKEDEQMSIRSFLLTWWYDLINNHSFFNREVFVEVYKRIGNVEELLAAWRLDFDYFGFLNFVAFIQEDYPELVNNQNAFCEIGAKDKDKLLAWIENNAERLESGFFHFDLFDKAISEKISNAQYVYERT